MKQIIIRKQNQIVANPKFSTQELANAWLQREIANKSFGKSERIVAESQIQVEGENIENAIEMTIEQTQFGEIKFYKFAAQYTVETVDVTAQVQQEKRLAIRQKHRAFGEKVVDKISTINESKNLSVEQVDAFMSNTLLAGLREHLWAGNITTFIAKLQASDVSSFFTNDEKAAVILECQTFLTSVEE